MITLAYDLGATSGRAVVGRFNGERLDIKEIHRFANDPVQVGSHLYWDILRIYHELQLGLLKCKYAGYDHISSMAIDSWAIDFGLLGKNDELLGNPYHYRDPQTAGMMEEVSQIISKKELFSRTGIQFMPINTIYHLYAMRKAGSPILDQAEHLLMIPDLLRFFLTGEKQSEFTNATTTQLFNARSKQWDQHIIEALGLPGHIFGEVSQPAKINGQLRSSVSQDLGMNAIPLVAVAEHDTASAVVAVPAADQDFAYLSCGTWSLLGTEVTEPVLTEHALNWNFTNEGGIHNTYRLLKNIMGLWIIEECRRVWAKEGTNLSYEQLIRLARDAQPFVSFIDPDDHMFLKPSHMPDQIKQYCQRTGQPVPESQGEIINCVLTSLALKYRLILERTEQLANKSFAGLHMVGGGIKNTLLCQYTANAIGRPVWAGPVEATAVGNLLVQYMAQGQINSLQEARLVSRHSYPVTTYEPEDHEHWTEAYAKFRAMTKC
ncbi:rhamnulokinase [Caldalkalibacillus uzonensis]|uniref:Rhamnulokinase n=1 Tax=Caldalkalibacillus uzonensis TaxID=353224 RepID=A0ABU0CQK8_9BACI|nr:rhamnulokinase family protein [Caldalkalibacillus uzonensis]MDQ0338691.1 rhamnulokinase [Caldalkalibacillus uzonensis]